MAPSASLNPCGARGTAPGTSGPKYMASGLLPTRPIPRAGWIATRAIRSSSLSPPHPAVTRLGSVTSAAAAELRCRNARRDVSSTPQPYIEPRPCPGFPSTRARLAQTLLSTNQFKNGNHIEVDGTVFKVLEFQHVKPGKGGAFVRTRLRRAADGAVIDRTFRAGEKFRAVRTESRRMQFLYSDGTDAHFMDSETFEQMTLPEDGVAQALRWIKPSEEVDVLYIDDRPADVNVPSAVELEVTQTDPGVKGDTASGGGTKPATLETGAVVHVPLFIDAGERVRVDTRSGEYVSRA